MEPLRILIASDIHLGFMEKDAERGEDTFNSFEEFLQIAKDKNVDMILLGGDLFHIQRPSLNTLKRCIDLLRKYCWGDDPIKIKLINESQDTFDHSEQFPYANCEERNVNVSLPVFSIHGDHDDPSGRVAIGAVELFHGMGLVNYFGKQTDLSHVKLSPILIQKGDCKLALYGLGAMPDERCHRIFMDGNISYTAPENGKSWFKVMVVHQNRYPRQVTKYLPEKYLAGFADLVVWGHEHEPMPLDSKTECNVFQPGSSVITALNPGEDQPKQVGLLEVYPPKSPGEEQKFNLKPIKLETVRRLYLKDVYMENDIIPEIQGIPDHEAIMDRCERLVKDMISDAEAKHTGNPKQPRLPLIRLRIFFEDPNYRFQISSFGLRFLNRVANPQDIVKFTRKRASTTGGDDDVDMKDQRMMIEEAMDRQALEENNINDIIKEYFEDKDTKLRPAILPTHLLIKSVRDFVEKEATDAIDNALENLYKNLDDTIIPKIEDGDESAALSLDFKGQMKELKEALEGYEKNLEATLKPSSSGNKSKASDTIIELGSDSADESDDNASSQSASKKGRGAGRTSLGGRGGGRTSRCGGGGRGGGRGRGGGKASSKKRVNDSDEDDDSAPELTTPRPSAPARSAKSSAKKKYKLYFSSSSSSD